MRATVSVPPPAPNPMTILTVRFG